MTIIKINSSILAAFISKNQHIQIIKIFHKLWKKYFFEEYTKIYNDNINNNFNIISKKYNINIINELNNICNFSKNSKDLKINQKKLLKKIDNDNPILKKQIDQYLNSKFGIIKEIYILDYYNKTILKIFKNIPLKYKKIYEYKSYKLYLIGKIDALNINGNILEIKNRIYKLHNEVKEYEWIQIQSYLELYNLQECELIEYICCSKNIDNIKIHNIKRNKHYWDNEIINDLIKYYTIFIDLINNSSNISFFKLSNDEQNEFIKKIIRDKK